MNKVETLAKGEIASFEQFLLLPQCFQKTSAAERSESVYLLERVKFIFAPNPNFPSPFDMHLRQTTSENFVVKRRQIV